MRESECDARQMRTTKFQGASNITFPVTDGILWVSSLSGHFALRCFGMGACIVSEALIINSLILSEEGLQIDDVSNEE